MVTLESLQPGADKKMTGSMMICEAKDIEEVKKLVESDIYYTSKVVSGFFLYFAQFVITSCVCTSVGSGEISYCSVGPHNTRAVVEK
jgi:hypothetical protein